jgi:GAF domain-containing protein
VGSDRDGPGDLTFPDGPRLELDALLAQLVGRAQEVLATQGRLRGLLAANQMVIGDLALPAVLRHIVDAARNLVGARYAALGVIGADGRLAEFVHAGMPDDEVAAIGPLPEGKGLLGALIDDPEPIRLAHITDDARSSGFPDGHPPMDSFLGVPIRVRDEVFGHLYLAESGRGAFSDEDVQLAQALAATAAVAIDNARLYAAAQTRQRWLEASAAITQRLLAPDAADPLQQIAAVTRDVAGADWALVVMPTEDGAHMRVEIVDGPGSEELAGLIVPIEGSLSGEVMTTGRPQRATDPADHAAFPAASPTELGIGPALLLPLRGTERLHGVLAVARATSRTGFTDADLTMAGGFAAQAALALDLAQARALRQQEEMHDERDRIAADLHDHVIQRLFAAGLTLQSVAAKRGPDTDRILSTIGDLDTVISQIRSTVFTLQKLPSRKP